MRCRQPSPDREASAPTCATLSLALILALSLPIAACGGSSTPGPVADPGTGTDANVPDAETATDLAITDVPAADGPAFDLPDVPACTPGCTVAGARKCESNVVRTCSDPDGDGCLGWTGAQDCGDLLCSNGFCATTCQDECTVSGARACDGNGVKTCGELDDDGCLEWGLVTACGEGTVCSGGTCGTTCKDECTVSGARQCDDVNGGVQTCGDANLDGCLEWGTPAACPEGQVCSGGLCATTCKDECPAVGSKTCNDAKTGFRTCGPLASGCLGWGSDSACGEGETCSNGTCASTCKDECTVGGARRCGGTGIAWQECGDANGDGCLEWGSLVTCADGETCAGGFCQKTCVSECSVAGARKCADSGIGWRECGDPDGDGCLSWGGELACGEGLVCSSGNCASTCKDECTVAGARQCDGPAGFQTCGDPDGDGCLTWGTTDNCLAGETCSNGTCALDCQDECTTSGAKQCDDAGGGVRSCGQSDGDACLEWGTPVACPAGQVCSAGSCAVTCTDDCPTSGVSECDGAANGYRTCKDANGDGCLEWGSLIPCGTSADCADGACQAKPAPGKVLISEIFYDPTGPDSSGISFVELRGPAGLELAGFVLAGVNGADGKDYNTIALAGTVPSDGLFVVASSAASWADLVTSKADYQNGPDSVVVRWGATVVDAIGYGTFGGTFAGEGSPAPAVASGHSLSRDAAGTDTDDNAKDFADTAVPTPGATEAAPVDGPPVAAFSATVLEGLGVRVDASASSDVETPAADLEVRWDWQADGTWDTAWDKAKVATHTYASAGAYTIRLAVRDGAGAVSTVDRNVAVAAVLNVKAEILTTTWSGLVNVTGNAWVAAGNTLTIAPGTTVTVTGDYTFDVKGKLLVKGDPGAPVTFASSAGTPSSWAGIVLVEDTQDHYFDHAVVRDARVGLTLRSPANVTNTKLSGNGVGMYLEGCPTAPVVTSVEASSNSTYGIRSAGSVAGEFQRITVRENGSDGLLVEDSELIVSNGRIEKNGGNGLTVRRTPFELRHSEVSGNRIGVHSSGTTLTVSDSRISGNRWEGLRTWDEDSWYSYKLSLISVTNSDVHGNGTEASSRKGDVGVVAQSSTTNYTEEKVYTTPVTAPDDGLLAYCQVNYSETEYYPGNGVFGSLLQGADGTTEIKKFSDKTLGAWFSVPLDTKAVRGMVRDVDQKSYGVLSIVQIVYHAPAAVVDTPIDYLNGAHDAVPKLKGNWWGVTGDAAIQAHFTNIGWAADISGALSGPAPGAGVQP